MSTNRTHADSTNTDTDTDTDNADTQQAHPLLKVENLSVEFKQGATHARVVDDISFHIDHGEIIALVGESGSGKSVTAHAILRLLPYPTARHPSGRIHLSAPTTSDRDPNTLPSPPINLLDAPEWEIREIRGNRISMIFQEPMVALNPLHTVFKQIAETLSLHNGLLSKNQLKARTLELLEEVGIHDPESRLNHYPNQLSGGQRQRVMIAMALANQPELLIADEPTTALDVTIQRQILDLLKSLQAKHNLSILLITHDFTVVKHLATRCLVMQQGSLVESATTDALFATDSLKHPDRHPYTKTLLEAEPAGTPLTQPDEREQALLNVEQLKVWFPIYKGIMRRVSDHFRAVNGISLNLKAGETIGIVGESGSGKSTLAMAILRLIESKGRITYRGQYLHKLSSKQMRPLRNHIQVVFQDPFGSLSPRMSVEQILEEGLKIHCPDLSSDVRQQKIIDALKEVDLDPKARHRYPHEFSGGQRQRISIARALVLQPKLVVLDEPTSALDRSVQGQVIDLLRKLQQKYALSYLFISHDLKVVRALSHKVMVMKAGKVIESGSADTIFNHPQNDYTKALLEAAH